MNGATRRERPRFVFTWPTFLIGGVVLWAAATTEVDIARIASAGPRLQDFLGRMFPPDLSVWREVRDGMAETLRIAVIGTVGCVVLSAVLGLLAAERVSPRIVAMPVRMLLAILRAIPLILVAMLMVSAVGLGPLPGILAITLHGAGMLGKYYAEAIDDVDPAPSLALESAGANRIQSLLFAAWPQMAPIILRDTIFRFELNLRESLILGVVGAGGIGFYIQTYVRAFQYQKAATVTIAVLFTVMMIEAINAVVRRRAA